MSLIPLLHSVARSSSVTSLADPTTGSGHTPLIFFERGPLDPGGEADYRTKRDIVWSCLATIFACTWAAIHPNLPDPWDPQWARDKRRAVTFIYAILAPEFMALWAMRQHLAARRIARAFNELVLREGDPNGTETPVVAASGLKKLWMAMKKVKDEYFRGPLRNAPKTWTITHGFFVQMGGFIGYEGDTPKRVLMFDELKEMVKERKLKVSDYTEGEIMDKSKNDNFTKLVVVLQTTWFICQCLARWATSLPITELEVVTLAFAALNAVTYGLWWEKPQDVFVGVRVQLGCGLEKGTPVGQGAKSERGREKKESWLKLRLRDVMSRPWNGYEGLLSWHWEEGWLIGVPLALLSAPLRPLRKMAGEIMSDRQPLRVPVFSADDPGQKRDLLPLSAICVLFGAIHLVPWWSPFPSSVEAWLWRSSAAVITAGPLILVLAVLAMNVFGIRHDYESDMDTRISDLIMLTASFLGALLYILARVALLTLAFTNLRSLPPRALIDVEWTTFPPHI